MSLGKIDEAITIAEDDILVKNIVVTEAILLFVTSILALIIIYKYFAKDNKEWKEYVKENKL